MATIDSSIYSQLQQPALPNPLAQAAQLSQLQGGMAQNQLVQAKLQQVQKDNSKEQGINDAYAGSLNPDGTINREKLLTNIANAGYGSQIPTIQKNLSDADKAKADTSKTVGEVQKQKLGMYRDALSYVDSPQAAIQWLKSQYSDPDLSALMNSHGSFDQIAAGIPTDPLKFSQWKPQAALGMTKFAELDKPTFQTRNTGGSTDTIQLPGMGGAPTVVSSIRNTQSPDSIASNATTIRGQNMTDARAKDTAIQGKMPVGYRIKPDGSMEAIPGGPADLKASATTNTKINDAKDVLSLLDEVDTLLPKATGSGVGRAIDSAGNLIGKSTEGAEATAQLKVLEGAIVSKMPKMSGPQSDKDVLLYREMAGQIADPSLPVSTRKKAAQTVRAIQNKYAGNSSSVASNPSAKPSLESIFGK